ncbi:GntR family transcriptional regulator [Thermomonospora amylolytica]|uniref:GntR family transcriptional regulator n=1 Tax=Thermomonospora amylolytica TaxID=1411117 RepID=UPI00130073F1
MGDQVAQQDDRRPSRRIAAAIRKEIESGTRRPGAPLPSYRELSQQHGVSKSTAQTAVQILADEGLVIIRPASGAYVRDPVAAPATDQDVRAELAGILERLHRARKDLDDTEQAVTALLERLPPASATE